MTSISLRRCEQPFGRRRGSLEQTNGNEIERSARNWRYTFSLQNPFLITTAQIKIVFLFQVGVIEKEIAGLGARRRRIKL